MFGSYKLVVKIYEIAVPYILFVVSQYTIHGIDNKCGIVLPPIYMWLIMYSKPMLLFSINSIS